MLIFDFANDVTSGIHVDANSSFTPRNSACRARIQILIPPSFATDGSQNVETDNWGFEETIGDKICDGNTLGGICGAESF